MLVILSPHPHADALHLLQPDSVLKRPVARTFDLDQVAVRAVERPVVVTGQPRNHRCQARDGTGLLPRTRDLSILAGCSSWWRRHARHAFPTSNPPDPTRGPPLTELRAAGCIDRCGKRGHGPRHWLPTAAPICKQSAARYLYQDGRPLHRLQRVNTIPPIQQNIREKWLREEWLRETIE